MRPTWSTTRRIAGLLLLAVLITGCGSNGTAGETGPSERPAAASEIDGTYSTSFTRQELVSSPLLYDSQEINDQNWGEFSLILDHPKVTFHQRNNVDNYATTGTYELSGDTIVLTFTEGGNAGETFTCRWRRNGDTLTFTRVESLEVPTAYVLRPWRKVG